MKQQSSMGSSTPHLNYTLSRESQRYFWEASCQGIQRDRCAAFENSGNLVAIKYINFCTYALTLPG